MNIYNELLSVMSHYDNYNSDTQHTFQWPQPSTLETLHEIHDVFDELAETMKHILPPHNFWK